MIMPSDTTSGNAGHSNGGTVTQPFVTETYRCVAPYETKDTKNKPFKVVMDEKVDVLIKDKAGERISFSKVENRFHQPKICYSAYMMWWCWFRVVACGE